MIRIALTQPDIRPYRIPAYNLLAAQPDIELHLFAGQANDAPNPDPDAIRFHFHHAPVTPSHFGPATLWNQPAQIEVVDPDRFDLVIHSWNARYRTLRPALDKARRLGLPTVVRGHGYSKRDSRLRVWLRNRLGRKASGILLYTHPLADRMIEKYGFDRDRVFVSQNAIDQSPIQEARKNWLSRPGDLKAFHEEHRLDPSRCVAFVSRLYRENRPDLLVSAIAELQERIPGCQAVIVGDGPERDALARQAAELGIAEHVRFTGALYSEQDLAPWLMGCGLFCYPENVGLSLLTAMGFGLPVITADNTESQNPEIVALRHQENGLLYAHGNPPAMAHAIAKVLTDRPLRESLSAEAMRTVAEDFTLPNMVQGYLDTTRLVDGVKRQLVVP